MSSEPIILVKTISDTQQVFGRPDVDINLFGCSGIGMTEAGTYKLDGDAFFVKDGAEVMAECMRAEPRYPGFPGKLFTEAV